MTSDEWKGVCLHIEECWPGEFGDETRAAYRTFLGQRDASDVMGALHLLVEEGHEFMPKPATIVRSIRKLQGPPVPSWAEAWKVIDRAISMRPEERCMEFAEDAHPIIAAFIATKGYGQLRLLEIRDGAEYAELRIRELGVQWEEFVEVAQERARQGRAMVAAGRREAGPQRLDPAAVLGLEPPEGTAGSIGF